jgi:hypothetical protein
MQPGSNFVVEMHEAARAARRTIAVLSPAFLASPYCLAEWAVAFQQDPAGRERRLIPVRVRSCEPDGLLGTIVYVDLVDLDPAASREALLAGLSADRVKPPCAPAHPESAARFFAGADYEHIWRRTLPEPYHVVLCDLYHLKQFVRVDSGRRETYFAILAGLPTMIYRVLGCEPSEQDVVCVIAGILGRDRTFLPYVRTHGGAVDTFDPIKWRMVLEAGAGAIVGEYLVACEAGEHS